MNFKKTEQHVILMREAIGYYSRQLKADRQQREASTLTLLSQRTIIKMPITYEIKLTYRKMAWQQCIYLSLLITRQNLQPSFKCPLVLFRIWCRIWYLDLVSIRIQCRTFLLAYLLESPWLNYLIWIKGFGSYLSSCHNCGLLALLTWYIA